MGIDISPQEILEAINRIFGISLSDNLIAWITLLVALYVLLRLIYPVLKWFVGIFLSLGKAIRRLFYSTEDKDFVEIRNLFIQHLIYEVRRLNRETDWNDFHYTALEAEVEIDPDTTFLARSGHSARSWLSARWMAFRSIFISPAGKTAKDLVSAIMHSKAKTFLVIGDPGSGKTVSLRHLFLNVAEESARSKSKSAQIPIYLNLKRLDILPTEATAQAVSRWVIDQLIAGQDRTISNFVNQNFETLLLKGNLFIIFDSFDEIPAVMDAQEDEGIVNKYAKALDDFLHASHQSKGLVSSRPYRAPKVFIGQRLNIRPLSFLRVRKALFRYLIKDRHLAHQIWGHLLRERDDLLRVIQTPFYLALLVRYVENSGRLPSQQYELFESFVVNRANSDQDRLLSLGYEPETLLEQAGRLAYEMTASPHLGLETTLSQLPNLLEEWGDSKARLLMDALHYSKLGKISYALPDGQSVFSFVHRRFHEYFVARHLREQSGVIPFNALLADNRWREILVLLCEVLPKDKLRDVIQIAKSALINGLDARSGSEKHHEAIEALRFIKDGFKSRVDNLPKDLRILVTQFVERQFETEMIKEKLARNLQKEPIDIRAIKGLIVDHLADHSLREILAKESPSDLQSLTQLLEQYSGDSTWKLRLVEALRSEKRSSRKSIGYLAKIQVHLESGNLLDQKRAVESISVADQDTIMYPLGLALNSDSIWLREVAITSCRALTSPSEEIKRAIREHLHQRHYSFNFIRDFSSYALLFSSPPAFYSLLQYLRILVVSSLMAPFLFIFFLALGIVTKQAIFLVWGPLVVLLLTIMIRPNLSGKGPDTPLGMLFLILITAYPFLLAFSDTEELLDRWSQIFVLILLELMILFEYLAHYLVKNYIYEIGGWLALPFKLATTSLRMAIHRTRNLSSYELLTTLVLGLVLLLLIGGSIYLIDAVSNALGTCGIRANSLSCIYESYDLPYAILVSLGILLAAILGFFIIFEALKWLLKAARVFLIVVFYSVPYLLWLVLIKEPLILRRLSFDSSKRPKSINDALVQLDTFIVDYYKVQYIHMLQSWYTVTTDLDKVREKADEYNGTVRDELYKLLEIWQDAEKF